MKNKQVLLTGGTGGLGLGVTPTLLAKGAKLTIPYHNETGVKLLKERLSSVEFDQIRFVKADLTQEKEVEQVVNDLGKVDILVHLVGGFSMGPTHEFSFADWQSLFQLNLDTTFLVCKHCLKLMREQKYGRIVTIGAKSALQPGAQLAAYCATKAGVVALTQTIAAENKDLDITANAVLPSIIDTPSNREAMGSEQVSQWIQPESIGEVIGFLVSDAAKDLTGAVLPM